MPGQRPLPSAALPILRGVYVDDAAELERWPLQEREQWQQALIQALNRPINHDLKEIGRAALTIAAQLPTT